MDSEARRRLGAWYTPPELAVPLATETLAGLPRGSTVVDLACGDGALLAAAAEINRFRLIGIDIDPGAVHGAEQRLPGAEFHCADGLTHAIPTPDAILANPPFLFGKDRPDIDTSAFELGTGQWDVAWLFVERAVRLLKRGGRFGFVLPDAILARHETARVRSFLARHAATLGVRHDDPAFPGAQVSTVLLWGEVGEDEPEARLRTNTGTWTLALDGGPWPPLPRIPDAWERLGQHVHISRGDELGKRGLLPIDATDTGVAVVSGEGIQPLRQPTATHWAPSARLTKRDALFAAPKIVVVKTGRTLRAGVDLEGLRTLQSVYNLQPHDPTVTWTRFLCGLLNSKEVQRRFIEPYTTSKKIFPQITQRMLADIHFPRPSPEIIASVAEAVAQEDLDEVQRRISLWMTDGCGNGGSGL